MWNESRKCISQMDLKFGYELLQSDIKAISHSMVFTERTVNQLKNCFKQREWRRRQRRQTIWFVCLADCIWWDAERTEPTRRNGIDTLKPSKPHCGICKAKSWKVFWKLENVKRRAYVSPIHHRPPAAPESMPRINQLQNTRTKRPKWRIMAAFQWNICEFVI